jgi:ATP-dependent DNA helicase RecG
VSESNLDLLPAHTPVTDLAETLVAMANSRGGTLHIELGDATIEDAIDLIREASLQADPTLILPEPILRDQVVEIIVPAHLPHVFSLNGRYLARDGRNNRSLVGRELRRLLIERGDVSYEDELASGATLDDLDWSQVEAYARRLQGSRSESPRDVLRRRGCVVVRDGEWLPTNAGILLFGKEPERFIRGAHITAARFGGTAMGDVFTRQDITGSLPDQIHRAETFLLNSLWRDVHLGTTMSRDEELEYPMEAARELVVNAVSHRDYSIQGDGIRLFIFSDRLEVTSPGGLPGPVTVDNIVDERYSRNSIIVQVLADMGFIERLGYGVDRVIALMQERGLPPPEFAETGGGFRVRLFNAGIPDMAPAVEIPLGEGLLLNVRQERALQFLTQGDQKRITNGDLQALFPDVHPETIRRDLVDLVGKGLLVKLGQKRGSYYVLQK